MINNIISSALLILLTVSSLHAQGLNTIGIPTLNVEKEKVSNKLNTKKDLDKFLGDLTQSSMFGSNIASYSLGLFWDQGYVLTDGTKVIADKEKAFGYYKKALSQGSVLAAYNVSLYYALKGRWHKVVMVLGKAIDMDAVNPRMKNYLVNVYASNVLDHFGDNKDLLLKSEKYLTGSHADLSVPATQYYLANVYNLLGEYDKADLYLVEACTSKRISKKLASLCMGSENIEVTKIDKPDNSTCPSCLIDQ